MKKKCFIFFLIFITGCDNSSELAQELKSDNRDTDLTMTQIQFIRADKSVKRLLEQLENPNISHDLRTQILCKDYPNAYKRNYIPALLRLSPNGHKEDKLLSELENSMNSYKLNFNIKC